MPLGIITDEQFNQEIAIVPDSNNDKEISARLENIIPKGRPEGRLEVPNELRKIIGESALEGTSSKELQELFNVSPSSVSAYKNGATSTATYNEGDKDLRKHISESKERISKRAELTLTEALNALTPEKINKAKARDISGIAKDMSIVMKNMEPEKDDNGNDGKPLVQFTFHVPPMKKEENYEVIQVEQ